MIMILVLLCFHFVHSFQVIFNDTEVLKATTVNTHLGSISGIIVQQNSINVTCFLGVPYAEKPIGRNRFAKSKVVSTPWKGMMKAIKAPPLCYQSNLESSIDDYRLGLSTNIRSEDCLYLSIYTSNLRAVNKTVLVWIHGGAFLSGSSLTSLYDHLNLVTQDSNILLVTINYRLNVFGFLTSGTDKMPGNFGFHDQILALKWIQQNIRAFGGNPHNVVLWGHSAGAASVGYHMMSSQSGDLYFRRAILQSGNPLFPVTIARSSYRVKAFLELLEHLNCRFKSATTLDINRNINKIFQCLQSKSTGIIFEKYQQVSQNYPLAFQPFIEDESMFDFDSLWSGIQSGQFNFNGEILIGSNEAEGVNYLHIGPLRKFYHMNHIDLNFTIPNIINLLKHSLPRNSSLRHLISPTVSYLLEDSLHNPENVTELWHYYVKLLGDFFLVCPDYFFINSFSTQHNRIPRIRIKQSNEPSVYYYRFRPGVSHSVNCPAWSPGACHANELPFVFGTVAMHPDSYPDAETKLSQKMLFSWLHFAHFGNFSQSSFKTWTKYFPHDAKYFEIDSTYQRMVEGFPADRCLDLMKPIYEILYDGIDENQIHLVTIDSMKQTLKFT